MHPASFNDKCQAKKNEAKYYIIFGMLTILKQKKRPKA